MGNYDALIKWANKKGFSFDKSKSDEAIAEDLRQFAKDASRTPSQRARFDPFEADNIRDSFKDAGTKFQQRTLELRNDARNLSINDLGTFDEAGNTLTSGRFGLTTRSTAKTLEQRFNLDSEEAKEIADKLGL